MEQATKRLRQPAQWTFSGRSGLFVPENILSTRTVSANSATTEVHPPVPNEWVDEFGLPIADGDATQDPDADGFSNLRNGKITRYRPIRILSRPHRKTQDEVIRARSSFRLVFARGSATIFAINTSDLKEPTQFLRIGDSIRGTKFAGKIHGEI